jgi:EmrB/QacA subfamily drug resistance transporter
MDDSQGQRRSALLVCMAASFLTPFSSSALNLAIPAIGRELGGGAVTLSWVVTSFLLASASLLLPVGRLADIVGRKRVFIAGIAIYSAASLVCGAARSIHALIAARAVQGGSAAMIFATSLAIVTSVFPAKERGRVLGVSVTAVYVGLSLGPIVGGILTESLGWRSIFLLTAGLGALTALLPALRLRGEWRGAAGQRFDWPGAALSAAGIAAGLRGLSGLSTSRLAPAMLAAGAALLVAFILWERRASAPLLDLKTVTGNATFAFSNLAALINYSATFAVTFVLSLHLQLVRGLDARHAGLVLLMQPVMMALLSPWAGRLSDRHEPRIVASVGMALSAGGLALLGAVPAQAPLAVTVAALAVVGTGFALFSSPNSNAVMGAVAREQYGVAAAVLSSMRLIGQALSMAIVTLIIGAHLPTAELARESAPALVASEHTAFAVFTALCVLGIFASLARGRMHSVD